MDSPRTVITVIALMDKNSRGFTLLEVVLVLFIMAMMATGALSSYRSFDQTKRLEADADAFVEAIELAKKFTSSGQRPCVAYNGRYRVVWSGTTVVVSPMGCPAIQTLTLKGNEFITATSTVEFKPFARGTSLSGDLCILMRNIYHNQCRKIILEKSGTVHHEINTTCSCS